MEHRKRRPNFLVILTDEERYPVPEESAEIKEFRETQLPGHKILMETGMSFHNHFTAATACPPSRASLFTGQYPSLHEVSQTNGFAKTANDPRIQWLESKEVPTMGNFFQEAGYETIYKGKWHISKSELFNEEGEEIETIDEEGKRVPEAEKVYLEKQPLQEFGFSDWIGPEPHGVKLQNGGLTRDPTYSDQVAEYLERREERKQEGEDLKPFLLVASLVNPHDIALYPQFKSLGMEITDPSVPSVSPSPSDQEDLETKPSAQRAYRETFQSLYCPPEVHNILFSSREDLRRLYYHLHKMVDLDICRIYEALKKTSFFEDTIIIFTSDHGDLLGSHGNLLQKWTVAYEEVIHIPLVISAPFLPHGDAHFVTSAVDILPTMIGLAGINYSQALSSLSQTHSEVHPLVGNDFSRVLLGELPLASQIWNAAYFMSEDEVTKGNSQISIRGEVEYDSIDSACHIEAIVTFLPNPQSGKKELWKFVRYFDNPANWSHPFRRDVKIIRSGPKKGLVEVRTEKHPEEFEVYNLGSDPHELTNLAHPSVLEKLDKLQREHISSTIALLAARLKGVSFERRITRNHPRPRKDLVPTYFIESKL